MAASVLIIDDDPWFRGLAVRLLEANGLTVAGQAEDARTGVAAAEALRPDAALVDVGLPDRDGIELAGELAALPWAPKIVVVSSDKEIARVERPAPGGGDLPFVAKEDLPNAELARLLGDGS
jgi:two-component system nitrate/nitrite response regulator NarL